MGESDGTTPSGEQSSAGLHCFREGLLATLGGWVGMDFSNLVPSHRVTQRKPGNGTNRYPWFRLEVITMDEIMRPNPNLGRWDFALGGLD